MPTLSPTPSTAPTRLDLRQTGEALGRYEILFPIASGGMATVYAARVRGEGSFQKPVALKLMLPHLARDERFGAMFMREATLAANIQSPHVVATLDLGREGEDLYMAMELVLGATLRELGGRGDRTLPLPVALRVLSDAARGLQDAHEACDATGQPLQLIHRDISPHNVLVGLDGRARIGDFGVARAMFRASDTRTGELKGKLAYFSPEQLDAVEDLDQRSDIFSLGIVAWEALVGRRLFQAPNPLALAKLIAQQDIARVDAEADVPKPVADVVARALERDRNARWPTAEAFGRALRDAAEVSCGMAEPREVGEAVRRFGGERVETLERRVRRLMREPSASHVVTGPVDAVGAEDATGILARREAEEATTAPGAPAETPAPAGRRPGALLGLALALAGAGALGFFSLGGASEGPAAPARAEGSPAPAEEAPAPPSEAAPAQPTATEESPPTVAPEEVPEEPSLGSSEEETEVVEEIEPPPRRVRPRRRGGRSRTAMAAPAEPGDEEPDGDAEGAAPSDSPTPMMGSPFQISIDHFERELQR